LIAAVRKIFAASRHQRMNQRLLRARSRWIRTWSGNLAVHFGQKARFNPDAPNGQLARFSGGISASHCVQSLRSSTSRQVMIHLLS
jgi:hypothetical protein